MALGERFKEVGQQSGLLLGGAWGFEDGENWRKDKILEILCGMRSSVR